MTDLLTKIKTKAYEKINPGKMMLDMRDKRLRALAVKYKANKEALFIGAYLSDFFIDECLKKGDLNSHVDMALKYAKELFENNNIEPRISNIIMEIISTHHKGLQKYIESRIFRNVDAIVFLEPRIIFLIFGTFYNSNNPDTFDKAIEIVRYKVEEKIKCIDLDEDLINEAKMLYNNTKWIFDRIGVSYKKPEFYK